MKTKIIWIIIVLLIVLTPGLIWTVRHLHKRYLRYVCGTNLKELGKANTVYANDYDYDDEYIVPSQFNTGAHWVTVHQDPNNSYSHVSVGASLYQLVQQADVTPKSFTCPAGKTAIDCNNASNIVELWDFENPPSKDINHDLEVDVIY